MNQSASSSDDTVEQQKLAAASPSYNRHPKAFFFIFWGEFAERASYYGMRAILMMYLTSVIGFATTSASKTVTAFKMGCYFFPLVGGYVADRWFGRYWTIVGFSVPYVLGHFILGMPNAVAVFIALALLAGGSGVIKPNISTLMGQTYDKLRPGNEILRSAAFQWFYFAINIGALSTQFTLPLLRDHWGYALAFQFPAWLMVGALGAFAAGKKHYALDIPQTPVKTPEEKRLERKTIIRLLGVFGLMVFFWLAWEHNDTLWVAFIRDYVDRTVPGTSWVVSPDQLQFINALCVITFIPLFNFLFARIDPSLKMFTPMRKIFAGFAFTAVSIGLVALAGYLWHGQIVPGKIEKMVNGAPTLVDGLVATDKISMFWMVGAYIILTMGEVLLYGTALELAYTAAPKTMKGMITACFLVTIGLGNMINWWWMNQYGGAFNDEDAARGPFSPAQFFGLTALIVLAATIAFVFVGKKFQRETEAQPVAA
jgi:POT family proton-dependent oligopeptide transporter